ncbi:cell division cycle- protein [Penicillium rubens]|nr:cell division cycle- protein [Penicillium rubens]
MLGHDPGSPPQEHPASTESSPSRLAIPPLSLPFHHARSRGSPSLKSIRRPRNRSMLPRKQLKRPFRVLEHPMDVISDKETKVAAKANMQPTSDARRHPSMKLPHSVPEEGADLLPRIDKKTLLEVMDGNFEDQFDHVLVIDCHFKYEYEGGHIDGAFNYDDKEKLVEELFKAPKSCTTLVLHCEHTTYRAPIMAGYLRHQDRAMSVDTYPNLTYPDLYILNGGYSSFFAENCRLCFPQNYVEMSDKEHKIACERGLGKIKQRSKLKRAQIFTVSQHRSPVKESGRTECLLFGENDHNHSTLPPSQKAQLFTRPLAAGSLPELIFRYNL